VQAVELFGSFAIEYNIGFRKIENVLNLRYAHSGNAEKMRRYASYGTI